MQSLQQAQVTENGIPGDRAFYLVDDRRRMVNAKRFGALLTIVAEHDPEAGHLTISFPDGSVSTGDVTVGQPEAVTFFGRAAQARPVEGPFSEAISAFLGCRLRLMARPEDEAAVDRGKVAGLTLLGTASVTRLEAVAGKARAENSAEMAGSVAAAEIDHRRFRMSIEFEGLEAHAEDGWIDRQVRVGEALIRVNGHVGRCAVTTRDPESGERDLPVLKLLKAYRGEIPSEESLPFGVFGAVQEPGRIRIGDPVRPL